MAADALGSTPAAAGRDIRVLLVDDQVLVRRGFAALLAHEPGVEVVGEAGDGAQAVAETWRRRPDVVLMDIRMPRVNGLDATRAIRGDVRLSATKVLVLTTFALDEDVHEALRAGASGFLLKDTPPRLLLEAIAAAAAGDVVISPAVTKRLVADLVRRPVGRPGGLGPLDVLSEREREVLAEVARGRTNAEIGRSLYMSPLTAKTHVSRILGKLGARDRAQLVVIGYETGLVRPGG
ncbi:response regulator [Cellulomonas phragmiteti]|uniref:DNA-binding response regulator n=1 Tax=Cellulomonas phragmiteti TaxID=478780 RepID=A0ABQ4DJ43_9CELL|nr:response regulator transcription factor [Cellulomonas phragmiteti]GIG39343.1 DNA-binding response regulator [Cellulomonas phragmiteti]